MNRIYSVNLDRNCVTLSHGSDVQLTTTVLLNGQNIALERISANDSCAIYGKNSTILRFDFYSDCVKIAFSCEFDIPTAIEKFVLFADGVKLDGFDRVFTPQPRKNASKNMDYYHHMPDVSANGYNSPALLNLTIGSPKTWVGFGLLDLPDSKQYFMDKDCSIVVECPGGNKVVKHYRAPEMLITFPDDEWHAISLFREKLIEFERFTPNHSTFSTLPQWWKNPLVCTYGDQLVQERTGQKIDEAWVRELVGIVEKDWGIENANLIIDSSWQPPHSFDSISDISRFPNMRTLSDDMHERGHHLILWCTPLLDKITNGFLTRAQKLNVLSDYEMVSPYFKSHPGCYAIDYTSDNTREFLHQVCAGLFGSGEGQWNVDGVKLDFMAVIRDPAETKSYAHPERGIGIRELYLFLKLFSEEARKIKPDVIIDSTTGDPRFESFISHNRLHDTHSGVEEKELRAKIVSLACPNLPIDSDGALMYTHWLRNHYISAAIYAIPSLYYVKKFHDFRALEGRRLYTSDEAVQKDLLPREKKWFGKLFSMVKYRPDGYPVMDDFGNWRLLDKAGRTTAVSLRGDTVIYFPTEKNPVGYIFTMRDEAQILPLFGHKFSALEPAAVFDHLIVDYARDRIIVHLEPGVLYTFKAEDDGSSIDSVFSKLLQVEQTENTMDYVN